MKDKPEIVEENHLVFLDELRESGDVNMFGASPYLIAAFGDLSSNQAREILGYWMDTFSDRHPA